jgi:hypothetical protein
MIELWLHSRQGQSQLQRMALPTGLVIADRSTLGEANAHFVLTMMEEPNYRLKRLSMS